jgi:GMP synthase (glutamine-hydrolysing)
MIRALGIQNCALETLGAYADLLRDHAEVEFEIVHPYRGETLPAADTYDLVLVGGTPISAYDASSTGYLADELDFLREVLARQIPALGICCGAQMFAMLLGAAVRRAPTTEIGAYSVRLTAAGAAHPLLAGFPHEFPVLHWHGDMFEIPAGGALLAEGAPCANQVFEAGAVLGLQFHLETSVEEASRWAEAYADEIDAERSPASVIDECRPQAAERAELAARLVTNLVAAARLAP